MKLIVRVKSIVWYIEDEDPPDDLPTEVDALEIDVPPASQENADDMFQGIQEALYMLHGWDSEDFMWQTLTPHDRREARPYTYVLNKDGSVHVIAPDESIVSILRLGHAEAFRNDLEHAMGMTFPYGQSQNLEEYVSALLFAHHKKGDLYGRVNPPKT